jgi:hypothetical protein
VNKEVIKFNRQLSKFHSNVKLLEIDLHRNHFTQHGQHLNLVGKELVSSELAKIIGKLFHEICLDPIYVQWKDSALKGDNPKIQDKTGIISVKALNMTTEDDQTESRNCVIDNTMIDNKIRVSERPEKIPVTRSNDFLW